MVKEKGIDRDQLLEIIKEIFGGMIKKKYGEEAKFELVVNMDKGDIEIYLERTIVEDVQNPSTEISIKETTALAKILANQFGFRGFLRFSILFYFTTLLTFA